MLAFKIAQELQLLKSGKKNIKIAENCYPINKSIIEEKLNLLSTRDRLEGSSKESVYLIQELKSLIRDELWEKAYIRATEYRRLRRPFDTHKMQRLLGMSNSAIQQVKDTNAILTFGLSGCGKSLSVMTLCGAKVGNVTYGNVSFIGNLTYVQKCGEVKIGYGGSVQSETSKVICIKIDPKEIDKGIYPDEEVSVCDVPGWHDSRGPEVNLANALNTIRVLSEAKSLRIVVFISWLYGDKLQSLSDILLPDLVKLIPTVNKHLGSLVYIYSNFASHQHPMVQSKLKDMYEKRSDVKKADTVYSEVLKDIVRKIYKGWDFNYPQSQEKLLQVLVSAEPIENPATLFEPFIPAESELVINEQMTTLVRCVSQSLSRRDYEHTQYCFEELQYLTTLLKSSTALKNDYIVGFMAITDHLKKALHEARELFERFFAFRISGPTEIADGVYNIQKSLENARNAEKYLSTVSSNAVRTLKKWNIDTDSCCPMSDLFESKQYGSLIRYAELFAADTQRLSLSDPLLPQSLLKLQSITSVASSSLLSLEQSTKKSIIAKVDETIKLALSVLADSNFDSFANQLIVLSAAIANQLQERIGNAISISSQYSSLIARATQTLEEKTKIVADIAAMNHTTLRIMWKPLNHSFSLLQSASRSSTLRRFLNPSLFEQTAYRKVSEIFESLASSVENATQLLDEDEGSSISSIGSYLQDMTDMRMFVDGVNGSTEERYQSVRSMAWIRVTEIQMKFNQVLNDLYNGDLIAVPIDSSKLKFYYVTLRDALWLDDIFPGTTSLKMDEMKARIIQLSNSSSETVRSAALQSKNLERSETKVLPTCFTMTKVIRAIIFIQKVSALQDDIIELRSIVTSVDKHKDNIFKSVDSYASAISRPLNFASFDNNIDIIQRLLAFLKCLKSFKTHPEEVAALSFQIDDQIKAYFRLLDSALKENIEKLDWSCSSSTTTSDRDSSRSHTDSASSALVVAGKHHHNNAHSSGNSLADAVARVVNILDTVNDLLSLGESLDVISDLNISKDFDSAQQYNLKFLGNILKTFERSISDQRQQFLLAKTDENKLACVCNMAAVVSRFDRFSNNLQTSFSAIFQDCTDSLKRQADQIKMNFLGYVDKGEFEFLAGFKINLGENDLGRLRTMLSTYMSRKIKETKQKIQPSVFRDSNNALSEVVTSVFTLSGSLQFFKNEDFLSEGLESELQEALIDIADAVERNVESYIQNEFRDLTNFPGKYRKLEELKNILGDILCSNKIVTLVDSVKSGLTTRIEGDYNSTLKFDIAALRDHPKIIDLLTQLTNCGDPCAEWKVMLEGGIKNICSREIDHIRNISVTSVGLKILNPKAQRLQLQLEQTIQLFPKDLMNRLDLDIKSQVIAPMEHDQLEVKRHLEEAFSQGEYARFSEILNSVVKSGGRANGFEDSIRTVKDTIQKWYSNVKDSLNRNQPEEIVEYLSKLIRANNSLHSIIPLITNSLFDIRKLLHNKLKEHQRCVDEACSRMPSSSGNSADDCVKSLVVYGDIALTVGKDEQSNHPSAIFGSFQGIIKPSMQKIADLLKTNTKIVQDSLVSSEPVEDFRSVKVSMDIIETWEYSREFIVRRITSSDSSSLDTISISLEVQKVFTSLPSYRSVQEDFAVALKVMKQSITNIVLVNEKTEFGETDRDEFYSTLKFGIETFDRMNKAGLQSHLSSFGLLLRDIYDYAKKELEQKIKDVGRVINTKIKGGPNLTQGDWRILLLNLNQLVSYKKVFNNPSHAVEIYETFSSAVNDHVQASIVTCNNAHSLSDLANGLIQLKVLSINLPPFATGIHEKIDVIIRDFKKKSGTVGIGKLGFFLQEDSSGTGAAVVAEHAGFRGVRISAFNELTQKFDENYVLDRIEIKDSDDPNENLLSGVRNFFIPNDKLKKKLKAIYNEFRSKYQSLVENFLTHDYDETSVALVSKIKSEVMLSASMPSDGNSLWNAAVATATPSLIAHIFALWSLEHSQEFFQATDVNDRNSFLMQPHAAQVISIFRLLCLDMDTASLQNGLAEIGTGEGKSITLAVVAIVLALVGYDVSVSSYSTLLSDRDYRDFKGMFQLLGLEDRIHYGTFNTLCDQLINKRGDIRSAVHDFVVDGSLPSITSKDNNIAYRESILLVDEVDVLFSKSFYGVPYNPTVSVFHPTFNALASFIWNSRNNSMLNLSEVKSSAEFEAVTKQFSNSSELILEVTKAMLRDMNDFANPKYEIRDGKIGYVDHGDINFGIKFGYKTMFAHWYEHEMGSITSDVLEKNTYINLYIASFSYAEIPHLFSKIMGVTGTLQSLSEPKLDIIKNLYHIHRNTYMPSVYGPNKRSFREEADTKIESDDEYVKKLEEEIWDKLKGPDGSITRSVLVFFEDEPKLTNFYDYASATNLKDIIQQKVTEKLTEAEKEAERVMKRGTVKLLTKFFGRGIDFFSYDPSLDANGGGHVIVTFFPDEEADFVQFRGRVGRQGKKGSASLVLLDKDLDKYGITNEEIDRAKHLGTLFKFISEKRNRFAEAQFQSDKASVDLCKGDHAKAMEFLHELFQGNSTFVKDFLLEQNRVTLSSQNSQSRTIVLVDATGSMSSLLEQAKKAVGTVFTSIREVLVLKQFPEDSFELQFVAYRNYNCDKSMILESSGWEKDPKNLYLFIDKVGPRCGLGNEAIEIGLQHANRETDLLPVSQILLIGDMPPNTRNEVAQNRAGYFGGESYWLNSEFGPPTYYETELEALKSKGVTLHTVYLTNYAKEKFQAMANLFPEGSSRFFDRDSKSKLYSNLILNK